MAGAIARGLSLSDFEKMTIGQIVDYVITYNEIHSEEKEPEERQANQSDFDNF